MQIANLFHFSASILLAVFGVLDCVTTVLCLLNGGCELNPLMASLISVDISVFLLVKLSVACLASGVFFWVGGVIHSANLGAAARRFCVVFICGTLVVLNVFMAYVVVNNVLVFVLYL